MSILFLSNYGESSSFFPSQTFKDRRRIGEQGTEGLVRETGRNGRGRRGRAKQIALVAWLEEEEEEEEEAARGGNCPNI